MPRVVPLCRLGDVKPIRTSYTRVFAAAGLALGAAACTAILGTFEVSPEGAGPVATPDATSDGPVDTDAGQDAGVVLRLTNVTRVSAGARHTCALANDKVYCWGDNSSGQLGAPVPAQSPTPLEVRSIPPMMAVSAGLFHTCALEKNNPRVWCWGKNDCGQTGRDAISASAPTPQKIAPAVGGLEVDAVGVESGASHTCAVESGGALYCWGCNNFRQLAQATSGGLAQVPHLTLLGNYRTQSASSGTKHTCAVVGAIDPSASVGRVGLGCWGTEDEGALGDGLPVASRADTPVEALLTDAGANGVTSVSAGEAHTCAIDADQNLFCWGKTDFGQAGGAQSRHSPVRVADPRKAIQVATGDAFTCFLAGNKEVWCLGANESGQLGRGTQDSLPHPKEENVQRYGDPGKPMLGDVLTAGRAHACTLALGNLFCWGNNSDGQLGDGTKQSRNAPALVTAPAP